MPTKKVKLTKSQLSLYKTWTDDYNRIMQVIVGLCNDNLNLRLEKIAAELGVNLDEGSWSFDSKEEVFVMKDGAPAPGMFPGEPEADSVSVPVGNPEKSDAIDTI